MRCWTRLTLLLHFHGEADSKLTRRFAEYHTRNQDVYADFLARTWQAKATGRASYSQWVIIQAIRWDRDMQTAGDVFKINNDYIAFYARMAVADFPQLRDFFELRAMKPDGRRISNEETRRGGVP